MHICMEQNNNNLFWNKYYYILLFQFSSDTAYYDTSYKNHPNPSKRSDLHMLLLCRLRRLGQEKKDRISNPSKAVVNRTVVTCFIENISPQWKGPWKWPTWLGNFLPKRNRCGSQCYRDDILDILSDLPSPIRSWVWVMSEGRWIVMRTSSLHWLTLCFYDFGEHNIHATYFCPMDAGKLNCHPNTPSP